MQHSLSLEPGLPPQSDDLEEMIGLDFCRHDDAWLDYCSLGGHEHYAPPHPEQRLEQSA